MKEFTKALKYVLLSQILCWLIYFLLDDKKFVYDAGFSKIAFIAGIVLLIILLILYFVFIKRIITKNKLNSKKFNIFLFFIWIVLHVLTWFVLFYQGFDIIRPCDGLGCITGIEYIYQWLFMMLLPILILIINLIIKLYMYIKRKINI